VAPWGKPLWWWDASEALGKHSGVLSHLGGRLSQPLEQGTLKDRQPNGGDEELRLGEHAIHRPGKPVGMATWPGGEREVWRSVRKGEVRVLVKEHVQEGVARKFTIAGGKLGEAGVGLELCLQLGQARASHSGFWVLRNPAGHNGEGGATVCECGWGEILAGSRSAFLALRARKRVVSLASLTAAWRTEPSCEPSTVKRSARSESVDPGGAGTRVSPQTGGREKGRAVGKRRPGSRMGRLTGG
jgi:hypothetical protein